MSVDRSPLFLDTAYVLARLNDRDQWHAAAVRWEGRVVTLGVPLVTTEFVLLEIANALSKVRFRSTALSLLQVLRSNPTIEIVPVSTELLASGFDLYQNRLDKDWGLTDCTSFATMRERGVYSALTSDEHFRQAGFRSLLLEE